MPQDGHQQSRPSISLEEAIRLPWSLRPSARGSSQLAGREHRLKKLVADLSLDKAILQDTSPQKWSGPRWQCRNPGTSGSRYDISLRRACKLVQVIEARPTTCERRKDPKLDFATAHARARQHARGRWGCTDGCMRCFGARAGSSDAQPVAICALPRAEQPRLPKLPKKRKMC